MEMMSPPERLHAMTDRQPCTATPLTPFGTVGGGLLQRDCRSDVKGCEVVMAVDNLRLWRLLETTTVCAFPAGSNQSLLR